VQRLMRAMTMFGAPAGLIDAQHLATRDAVTQLGAPPIRIALLSSISGVTFEEAVPGSLVLAVHERFTAPQTFVLPPNEMRETASTVVNSTRHDRLFPAASLSENALFLRYTIRHRSSCLLFCAYLFVSVPTRIN